MVRPEISVLWISAIPHMSNILSFQLTLTPWPWHFDPTRICDPEVPPSLCYPSWLPLPSFNSRACPYKYPWHTPLTPQCLSWLYSSWGTTTTTQPWLNFNLLVFLACTHTAEHVWRKTTVLTVLTSNSWSQTSSASFMLPGNHTTFPLVRSLSQATINIFPLFSNLQYIYPNLTLRG